MRATASIIVPRISATIESVRPLFEAEWQVIRRGVPARRQGARRRARLFARPALAETYERLCREAAGAIREARIDAARAAWYRGFVAEAVDKFFRDTEVLDVTGRAPSRPADGRRLRALVGDGRGSGRLRLSRPHRAEMRPVEPGAGVPAATRAAARLRYRRDGPARRRLRPHRGRMRQARLRRSRGVLRRSGFRRRAAGHAAVRCTTTPNGGALVGRDASLALRPGTVAGHTPLGGSRRRQPARRLLAARRRARASRPSRASASSAPIPAMST